MRFDPELSMIRFGTGLGPRFTPPTDKTALLDSLVSDDALARKFPIPGFDDAVPSYDQMALANRAFDQAKGKAAKDAASKARIELRRQVSPASLVNHRAQIARALDDPIGFRDRLTQFWEDHFTVRSRGSFTRHLVSSFSEQAIRPFIAQTFPDMLRAVVTHPVMLFYLQQNRSIGPTSVAGRRRGVGLNENLARELLELHLVGVEAAYSQEDVRQLAELLTGLTYVRSEGVVFRANRAEPGAETVLGFEFGEDASLNTVFDALSKLAVLPQVATHLAKKMAVHFVSPRPDPGLIAAMADAYGPTGDLLAMTDAMVSHASAWLKDKPKVRQPHDFIVAGFRALGVTGDDVIQMDTRKYTITIGRPLRVMGQPWQMPPGPDGWSEAAEDWIIPQAMAGRITWAMQTPGRMLDALPDPRAFVYDALGENPPEAVRFAASAAENRKDGVGVVLASAAFQRR